jgi:hypothetical protein
MAIMDLSTGKPARSPEEYERHRRIKISLWAYAYEIVDAPMVSDAQFDKECAMITPSLSTGHAVVDEFFRTQFAPHTGQWIHHHPELDRIAKIYQNVVR